MSTDAADAQSTQPTQLTQARIGLSGARLRTLASTGGFAVDEHTGDRMIQSLQGVIDSLSARWHALTKLSSAPPMSETATARWVSGHMLNTATDAEGLLTQLRQAQTEFPTYVEAIQLAKRNYREREGTTKESFTKLRPEV